VRVARLFAGIVVLALVACLGIDFIYQAQRADAVALHEANSVQPQVHWSVTQRSFEPWASVVSRGNVRLTGGSGPAWVVELSAPGDSRFDGYRSVVVVSAVTGGMSSASVLTGS
jgi:hypothetical protein